MRILFWLLWSCCVGATIVLVLCGETLYAGIPAAIAVPLVLIAEAVSIRRDVKREVAAYIRRVRDGRD